ncbi:MAG: polyprenyl diphosphate synthase, partial [Myxococcota bacterium]|nr:polyprenyl diphosphate synthase [Myxococcota bacterium]
MTSIANSIEPTPLSHSDVLSTLAGPPLQHLALIMDGNGRWAAQRGLPRSEGHAAGAEAARRIVEHALKLQIPHLSLFAFSSLNWGRPSEEIQSLMKLLERFLREESPRLIREGVCLQAIGERSYLPSPLQHLLAEVEEQSSAGSALHLTLGVSYDGRRDVVHATRRLVAMATRGELLPADVTEPQLFSALSTRDIPDVDLLLRTSGERRLSGFLPLEA